MGLLSTTINVSTLRIMHENSINFNRNIFVTSFGEKKHRSHTQKKHNYLEIFGYVSQIQLENQLENYYG